MAHLFLAIFAFVPQLSISSFWSLEKKMRGIRPIGPIFCTKIKKQKKNFSKKSRLLGDFSLFFSDPKFTKIYDFQIFTLVA